MADEKIEPGVLFGLGNPLLDMQANVTLDYLAKYDLQPDNQILAEEKHAPIFEELSKRTDTVYVPGGATLNAIRVAQWLLGVPAAATFMGCVGQDIYADILKGRAENGGVTMKLQVTKETKTGTCAVLITGQHRSLVADLAAANKFTESHLTEPENEALLRAARFYYIAGYPLTVCPPAVMRVAKHAHENGRPFMMNLSAPFLSEFFAEPLLAALEYVDVLFGNETEAATFARVQKFDTTEVPEIALKIAAWPKKGDRKRMVVITQGALPVVVAHEGKVTEYPVPPLAADQIVDTNSAGDAFVAGFLAGLVKGRDTAECVRCGLWTARLIIQRTGCTYPSVCEYKW